MSPDSMPTKNATERAIDIACEKAEMAIERILLTLEYDTMRRIDQVNVDTRNFSNYRTEIFLRKEGQGGGA